MIIGFDGSRTFVRDRTGTENYSYQLLKHLAQIDKKNRYLVYLRPDTTVVPAKAGIYTNKIGSRIKSGMTNNNEVRVDEWPENFEFKKINYQRLWTQIGLGLQTFSDKLDILFTPAHTLPLVRKPGLKTVMTVHDLGSQYLPLQHQLKQRLYLGFITKFQLNSATSLIAVSQSTKNDLVAEGIDENKVKVIYEGFDEENFKFKKDSENIILKCFDLEKNKYFLFVGTVQPRKNLERLIKAFSLFLDNMESSRLRSNTKESLSSSQRSESRSTFKLVIAGGKGWMADEIYALPKKLGIPMSVVFTGRISDSELPSLYSNALALAYPSLYEGFGLPLLEAMASGTPVLTSKNSSLPEVAGDAAVYVDELDTNDITHGLMLLLDKDLRESLVKKGFSQVKKFSWKLCAEETLEVLEKA